jgi:acyl-CoA thioesterase-1
MLTFRISPSYVAARTFRNAFCAFFLCIGPVYAKPLILVAFGDSLTQGYGLPVDQGFVPQLQAYLGADNVTVINAGVSGDTTAGGVSRLDWTLTPDVQAVIVNLGGNDLLRGLPPEVTRANMDKIAASITGRGIPLLIVAMQAPPNYGPDYKAAFDAIYPDIAAKYGAMLTTPYFTPITVGDPDPSKARDFMQEDGIHPNAAGVAKLVAGHGPEIRAFLETVQK